MWGKDGDQVMKTKFPHILVFPNQVCQQGFDLKKKSPDELAHKKEDVVYIYIMKYYSAIKKSEIMPFAATWMDLEMIILNKVNEKETKIPYDITYMWNLKYDTNELL